ncbi:DUF3027 domain-containing protein [Nakamurella sp.]|uniref:DUF3027 domain-containing protein n=1 Tax=Nakamurella sp. TaxID=1869182 RepID=UPI003B3B2194
MADVNPVAPDTAGPDSSTIPPAPPEPEAVVLTDELIALARAAAAEEAGPDGVGDYLGAWTEDAVATSARFAATDRGYRGWHWLVTVAVVETTRPTISEVVLLPGDGALLAPAWVPWDQRVRPGDLGVGDLLPPPPDDARLVPGYLDSDDPAVREVEYEFGFGRPRVLGREGRDEAAQRWHDGSFGPADPMAKQAPAACGTCGFYVRLEGLLGQTFGACSNEFSPADGRVVDVAYGCGAHSETVIDAPLISASTAAVMDEVTLEVHRRPAAGAAGAAEAESEPAVAGSEIAGAAVEAAGNEDAAVERSGAESTGVESTGIEGTRAEDTEGTATVDEPAAGTDAAAPAVGDAIEPPTGGDSAEDTAVTDAAEPAAVGEPTEPAAAGGPVVGAGGAEAAGPGESTDHTDQTDDPVGATDRTAEPVDRMDEPVTTTDDPVGSAVADGDPAGPAAPDANVAGEPVPQP